MSIAVFSDIIWTLTHDAGGYRGELVRIDSSRFISKEAISLISKIQEHATFNLVTGSGRKTYDSVKDVIPHDNAIIEQGGIIYSNGSRDGGWTGGLQGDIKKLEGLEEMIKEHGFSYDRRETFIRLFRDGTEVPLTDNELKELAGGYLPGSRQRFLLDGIVGILHNLDSTPHPPVVDFIPAKSGKENAISHLLARQGISWPDAVCMGDDLNDYNMLVRAGFAAVIGNAHDAVKTMATGKQAHGFGYLSRLGGHDGTTDILKRVLEYVNQAR